MAQQPRSSAPRCPGHSEPTQAGPVPRLDRPFDRMLTIDKHTWQVAAEDGRFDSAAGAVASKIKRSWQERGEFPPGVVFSS